MGAGPVEEPNGNGAEVKAPGGSGAKLTGIAPIIVVGMLGVLGIMAWFTLEVVKIMRASADNGPRIERAIESSSAHSDEYHRMMWEVLNTQQSKIEANVVVGMMNTCVSIFPVEKRGMFWTASSPRAWLQNCPVLLNEYENLMKSLVKGNGK